MKALLFALALFTFSVSGFAQVQKQRLIAQSRYLNADPNACCTYVFHDSSIYRYSGARHSRNDFISLNWNYFMSSPQGGNYSPMRLINGIVKPNNIDSLQYASLVDYDTTAYYETDSSGKPTVKDFYTCDHYPDGKLSCVTGAGVEEDFIYLWGDLYRIRQVYGVQDTSWRVFIRDASGNVVLEYYGRYYTPTYFSVGYVAQFEFDALNRYTSHSESWSPHSSFFPEYRDYYEYYPDDKVKKVTIGSPRWPDSTYYASYIDSFGYTPGVPGYTSRNFYYLGASKNGYYDVTHINASGLVDTLTRTYWRPADTTREVFIMEYNSAGNPIVITKGQERFFYYYEAYEEALSVVKEHAGSSPSMLYPNPANDRVFVRDNDIHSISILDMTGKVVLHAPYSTKGVDVSELPAGNYIVKLTGWNDVKMCRLVKQ
jgi:hypothetical protein